MSDLIDRQAAIDALGDAHFKNYGNAIMVIQSLPSAEPVKHGKWIRLGRTMGVFGYACSECGESVVVKNIKCELYCPNCGARMDAE